ncbi:Microtubule-associated proteins 1A/1B light chain 3B [Trichinella zimbabwensis]|uniref:Microtubule-associated proteins 1A/1B light chain 3B n=1 Tax=Trichinella zimbabwensis TaxID=268475 RepID=A0A0V1HQR2_9BILA|nr:Microtubule-associated proteins 1A/1B light chain 3B [Trichinella zimbabwensis]
MGGCNAKEGFLATRYTEPSTYKSMKSFGMNTTQRKEEVFLIRKKYPTKVPIIIEKHRKDISLPLMEKNKFLIPQEVTVLQLIAMLRNRLEIPQRCVLYFTINGHLLTASINDTMADLYLKFHDEVGFLYLQYFSQDCFG